LSINSNFIFFREECGIFVFGGGMPRLAYGDRYTLSVVKGENTHATYDFTSKVIDFCLISDVTTGQAEALVVLAEEELIVIDLISTGWPTFSLPYLASLHCSAVTAQTVVTVTSELYDKIKANPQGMTPSSKVSTRPWPINGGISFSEQVDQPSHRILLLTGHEVCRK
jgi:lethal(2) giant larvae protein